MVASNAVREHSDPGTECNTRCLGKRVSGGGGPHLDVLSIYLSHTNKEMEKHAHITHTCGEVPHNHIHRDRTWCEKVKNTAHGSTNHEETRFHKEENTHTIHMCGGFRIRVYVHRLNTEAWYTNKACVEQQARARPIISGDASHAGFPGLT